MTIPRALNIGLALSPVLLVIIWPAWSMYEFSPRKVVYSTDMYSLFLAPWTCRPSLFASLGRMIQAAVVFRSHELILAHAYALWFVIAGVRTLIGFMLTRTVGWAFPYLFQHGALYESTSGLGPSLVALLVLTGVRDWPEFPNHRSELLESFVLASICAVLTSLDGAPWTYGTAVLLVIPVMSIQKFLPATVDATLAHTPTPHRRSVLKAVGLSLGMIIMLQLIPTRPLVLTFPTSPNHLLDIVVLSYPRPNDDPKSSILSTTLNSFIPLVAIPQVSLSVFTHTSTHPSFAWAKDHFSHVTFFTDVDTHPDATSSQYLHVAEALRWAGTREAEWVMLIEDDFPLCGTWGQESLARVMQELERGRTADYLERRGAFIGTGGSGLIFHRSLLPIVSTILRLHADTISALPVDVFRRPADLIMQDCLLGIDALCPRRAEAIQMHMNDTSVAVPPGENLVITSRLVIDHIGAVASTSAGRYYGHDQWRCGWRHPFHGRDEVDVVVV